MLPDIDLAHDSLFLILDQEAYYSISRHLREQQHRRAVETARHSRVQSRPKKYVVRASGMVGRGCGYI